MKKWYSTFVEKRSILRKQYQELVEFSWKKFNCHGEVACRLLPFNLLQKLDYQIIINKKGQVSYLGFVAYQEQNNDEIQRYWYYNED